MSINYLQFFPIRACWTVITSSKASQTGAWLCCIPAQPPCIGVEHPPALCQRTEGGWGRGSPQSPVPWSCQHGVPDKSPGVSSSPVADPSPGKPLVCAGSTRVRGGRSSLVPNSASGPTQLRPLSWALVTASMTACPRGAWSQTAARAGLRLITPFRVCLVQPQQRAQLLEQNMSVRLLL